MSENIFKQLKELEKEISQAAGKKKAVDHSGLSAKKLASLEKSEGKSAERRGVYCDKIVEATPEYIAANCEKVIREGNSIIVLGRDRPGSRKTGYGGSADTQASSIGMIVGPQGADIREVDENGKKKRLDPDFIKDSAMIHMSAKTDIDTNFGLAEGDVGIANAKSGIGIKADGVRIIGREGIKLITSTDRVNSQGIPVDTASGIDLIAGNDDTDLQPLVKGWNLQAALRGLTKQINALNGIFVNYVNAQNAYNAAVMNHYHYSPFFGVPTTIALDTLVMPGSDVLQRHVRGTLQDLISHKRNLVSWRHNYCSPAGKSYILSILNNTN